MWLKSDRLRLVGKADVVEFHDGGQASSLPFQIAPSNLGAAVEKMHMGAEAHGRLEACPTLPYPIEYKRGRRRRWDNDDVQLCAQALCLEEMLGLPPGGVPAGAIYHIKSKRRREVLFTDKLRRKTETAAARLHELITSGITPPAMLKPRCDGCSLREVCMPELAAQMDHVERYCQELFQIK
jgi:CRISPR-associated exonuclease Cas4